MQPDSNLLWSPPIVLSNGCQRLECVEVYNEHTGRSSVDGVGDRTREFLLSAYCCIRLGGDKYEGSALERKTNSSMSKCRTSNMGLFCVTSAYFHLQLHQHALSCSRITSVKVLSFCITTFRASLAVCQSVIVATVRTTAACHIRSNVA
jgi:hypothetical protein